VSARARLLAPLLLVAACADGEPPAPAVTAPAPAELPYSFRDATDAAGLAGFQQVNGEPKKLFVVESFGAGVALFDFDFDGDLDAYLTNGSKLEGIAAGQEPRDALYANDGGGRFTDVTAAAQLGDTGWTTGVRVVDLDGDGDSELYLTNWGPTVLYDNRGDRTFADVSEQAGVGDPRWSTGAAFLDHDQDGDLDLYVANYLDFDREEMLRERPRGTMRGHSQRSGQSGPRVEDIAVMKGPVGLAPTTDCFYLNGGQGRFRDASLELGIVDEGYGFQVLAYDADVDGWLDVHVINDAGPDFLWRNEQGRRFVERALRAGVALSLDGVPQGGMGGAVGDYDQDLVPDVFVSNYVEEYSTLYRGVASGVFMDATARAGMAKSTWSMVGWACGFVDFDSDGDDELFQVNGHVYPQVDLIDLGTSYLQPAQLFELSDGRYVIPPGAGGPGFAPPRAGRGGAVGDVDGDGDQDLLIGNMDGPPSLLLNEGKQGNWLKVLLVGPAGNRDAIGARLVLRAGGRAQLRLVGAGSGFLSSNDPREHFGLGQETRAERLEVTWPDGSVEGFSDLAAGRLYTIEGGAGAPALLRDRPLGGP
jgi:hypothetical protein